MKSPPRWYFLFLTDLDKIPPPAKYYTAQTQVNKVRNQPMLLDYFIAGIEQIFEVKFVVGETRISDF